MLHRVYLLLGGNKGDVREAFSKATEMLGVQIGQISAASPLYQTEPWGIETDSLFINQALCLSSSLHPMNLIKAVLNIEKTLGRVRNNRGVESRNIDIDILFLDEMIISEPGLEVPHPRLHLRRFALQPLCDIAPDLIHPIFNISISELMNRCDDPLRVTRLPEQVVGQEEW
jgi:2-amino-4-hydroxy-6-hydroxymethyldihydropteridine diphosphokinase